MSEKEEILLKEIINYVNKNHSMPTRRYLQKKLGFKSINSITQYIKSLSIKNYLTRNKENKLILDNSAIFYQQNLRTIKIINTNNEYIQVFLNKDKTYIGYKIHSDCFYYMGILKKDILITELNKKLKPNDLGLFIIDGKYRIMKYDYKDGFYILKDYEELLLSKIRIIGKVVMIERKL